MRKKTQQTQQMPDAMRQESGRHLSLAVRSTSAAVGDDGASEGSGGL
jgi:hypothetical protein